MSYTNMKRDITSNSLVLDCFWKINKKWRLSSSWQWEQKGEAPLTQETFSAPRLSMRLHPWCALFSDLSGFPAFSTQEWPGPQEFQRLHFPPDGRESGHWTMRKPCGRNMVITFIFMGRGLHKLFWCGRMYFKDLITQMRVKSVNGCGQWR